MKGDGVGDGDGAGRDGDGGVAVEGEGDGGVGLDGAGWQSVDGGGGWATAAPSMMRELTPCSLVKTTRRVEPPMETWTISRRVVGMVKAWSVLGRLRARCPRWLPRGFGLGRGWRLRVRAAAREASAGTQDARVWNRRTAGDSWSGMDGGGGRDAADERPGFGVVFGVVFKDTTVGEWCGLGVAMLVRDFFAGDA